MAFEMHNQKNERRSEMINILYCTDDNYSMITGISIISLLENNCGRNITIHVIMDNVSGINKDRLLEIGYRYNVTIKQYEMPDWNSILSVDIDVQMWSLSAFSRLFINKVITEPVDRILYLDCDIMVTDDISDFYINTDLKDYWAAGVQDCLSIFKCNAGFKSYDKYYNSGVLLLNEVLIRKDGVEQMFADYIQKLNGKVPYADQTVINAVMAGHIKDVHPRYNVMTPLFVFAYDNMALMNDYSNYYAKKEINDAIHNPALVHFTNGCYVGRPWHKGCLHPLTSEYIRYKSISSWANVPFLEFKQSKWRRLKQYKNHSKTLIRLVKMLKK